MKKLWVRHVAIACVGILLYGFTGPGEAGASPATVPRTPATPASAWSVTPDAASGTAAELRAIACPSATVCVAVGDTLQPNRTPLLTFAEVWNGTTWSVSSPLNVGTNPSTFLRGIACPTTSLCFAVGGTSDPTVSNFVPLIEKWNGTTWSLVSSPTTANGGYLTSIACVSATSCVAVGGDGLTGFGNHVLTETWNGTTWTLRATPTVGLSGSQVLISVSCITAAACTAVGNYYAVQSNTYLPLAERWNGTSWTIDAVPITPKGPGLYSLNSIQCFTSSNCLAVGMAGGSSTTLAEQWNGTSWSVIPAIDRGSGPSPESWFSALTCTSATSCIAVGQWVNDAQTGQLNSLVEAWNGSSWSVELSPTSPTAEYAVPGVACAAVAQCFAVGSTLNGPMVMTDSTSLTRLVEVPWSASEATRVQQVAAYFGVTPTVAQEDGVNFLAFLIGLSGNSTPTPATVPAEGEPTTITNTWLASDAGALDAVEHKYALNDSDATRLGIYFLSFLLALGGQ